MLTENNLYKEEYARDIQIKVQAILPDYVKSVVEPVAINSFWELDEKEFIETKKMGVLRLATFKTGRSCAKKALLQLGISGIPIVKSTAGAPIWPKGIVGSISHTNQYAIAIVTRISDTKSIGIDIEENSALDNEVMLNIICTPAEVYNFQCQQIQNQLIHGKIIFIMKEAVYKSFYQLTETIIDFHDIIIDYIPEKNINLLARIVKPPFDNYLFKVNHITIDRHSIAYSEPIHIHESF